MLALPDIQHDHLTNSKYNGILKTKNGPVNFKAIRYTTFCQPVRPVYTDEHTDRQTTTLTGYYST